MITIYTIKGEVYLPRDIIGESVEDCPDCVFVINLMRWFISEVVDLFRSPVQLIVFYLIILWPEILSVDITLCSVVK